MSSIRKLALVGGACCLGSLFLKFIYCNLRRDEKLSKGNIINEVLFFPDSDYPCSKITTGPGYCRNISCSRLHGRPNEPHSSMIKFLDYVRSAKYSVDLCIYMFTQSTIAESIKDLHNANIKVRIITDVAEDDAESSKLSHLKDIGIEIKSNKPGTGAKMHHKYLIIDNKVLLTGSFNFTNRAVVSNYENVIVTNERKIVDPFIKEFDKMWKAFHEHSKRLSSRHARWNV